MFFPYGDTPNPRGTAWLNWTLIGLNVAVFLFLSVPLMAARPDLGDPLLLDYLRAVGVRGLVSPHDILRHVSAYDLFVFRYGFRPGDPSPVSLFTCMFLHGGWLHVAGNMLFLWIFGNNVEARLGPWRYLLVYLLGGLAATIFFALFVPGSQVPLVGASGAISGVLGCYFLWFPRNQVKTFIFLFPFIMTTLMIPARFVLGFFLVVDNLLPFLIKGGETGVAHGAHIGGFLAGLGLARLIDRYPVLGRRRYRVR
jgi:membrane associated rhomboid family serine protease